MQMFPQYILSFLEISTTACLPHFGLTYIIHIVYQSCFWLLSHSSEIYIYTFFFSDFWCFCDLVLSVKFDDQKCIMKSPFFQMCLSDRTSLKLLQQHYGQIWKTKSGFLFWVEKFFFLAKKYGTFWSKINLVQNGPVWNKKKFQACSSIMIWVNVNKGNKKLNYYNIFFISSQINGWHAWNILFSSVCLCNSSVLAVKMCCLNPEKMHQKTKFFTKLSLVVVVVEFWEHYNNSSM